MHLRTAIFIDAGYLYAAGSEAISGKKLPRTELILHVPRAVAELKQTASAKTDKRPLLRIYWYDGARSAGLSPEHEALADSEDIKLRLGAVSYSGKQKDVDSLIVADLIDLARNHAIADAVLMSGDEDTRIGVQIAQSFGVRVHLVGIKVPNGNQSRSLRRESDTTTEWDPQDVGAFLSRKPVSEVGAGVLLDGDASVLGTAPDDQPPLSDCVGEFVNSLSQEELSAITDLGPSTPIPYWLDRRLLKTCSHKLRRTLNEPEKHQVRRVLKQLTATSG